MLAVLCLTALTSCARFDDNPPRRQSPLPSLTDSSERQVKKTKNLACDLLTAEERQGIAGQSMDAIVPSTATAGTQKCQWAHSLTGSRSSIQLVAFRTEDWAKVAHGQVVSAMRSKHADAESIKKLGAAAKKLARGPEKLSSEEVCDIYWTMVGTFGWPRDSDTLFTWMIGQMPATFSAGCSDGVYILLGYGEFGMQASTPLYRILTDLRKSAHDRAVKLFAEDDDAEAGTDTDDTASDAPSSDAPTPTETESSESESE